MLSDSETKKEFYDDKCDQRKIARSVSIDFFSTHSVVMSFFLLSLWIHFLYIRLFKRICRNNRLRQHTCLKVEQIRFLKDVFRHHIMSRLKEIFGKSLLDMLAVV